MIIDFRTHASIYDTKDQAVDCVESLDSKLTFEKNCEVVCKKGQKRFLLFFLSLENCHVYTLIKPQ